MTKREEIRSESKALLQLLKGVLLVPLNLLLALLGKNLFGIYLDRLKTLKTFSGRQSLQPL